MGLALGNVYTTTTSRRGKTGIRLRHTQGVTGMLATVTLITASALEDKAE